jgi:hypothetical protein
MTVPDSACSSLLVTIERLADPVLDEHGSHVTSRYCETFWLPVIGPSALWLLRHAAIHTEQGAYTVDVDTLARSIGLGGAHGAHAPIVRTLNRLDDFRGGVGGWRTTWALRTHLPPLTARQAERLPEPLRAAHEALLERVTEKRPGAKAGR